MDREAWWATVHGVTKNRMTQQLKKQQTQAGLSLGRGVRDACGFQMGRGLNAYPESPVQSD